MRHLIQVVLLLVSTAANAWYLFTVARNMLSMHIGFRSSWWHVFLFAQEHQHRLHSFLAMHAASKELQVVLGLVLDPHHHTIHTITRSTPSHGIGHTNDGTCNMLAAF